MGETAGLIAQDPWAFGNTRTRKNEFLKKFHLKTVAAHAKFSRTVLEPAALQYVVYGLRISCDRPIPGLTPLENQEPDIQFHFVSERPLNPQENETDGEAIWYESYLRDEHDQPLLKIRKNKLNQGYRIEYSHGLAFEVDSTVSTINVSGAERISNTELSSFLLGPVLGILLRMKGLTCLHASAAVFAGRSLVFAGAEGSGKSTAAAIFARRGHAVLADDIAVLERVGGIFSVRSGCPVLNLLSDSADWLRGSERTGRTEAETEKQRIVLDGKTLRFQREGLPLGAVFILDAATDPAQPFERLSSREALVCLSAETYANRMLDTQMRAAEFQELGALVESVPVLRINTRALECGFEAFYDTVCRSTSNLGFQ